MAQAGAGAVAVAPPDDGTVPPAYFVNCGVAGSDYIGFAPPYCARYGLTQQELLMLAMASHQCGRPFEEVITVYVGQCGRCFDQVVAFYQIDPCVFFVVLEPGIQVQGCLLRPYLWYERGCIGPTGFSNGDYQALIALKIGCEWDQCPQAVIVGQLEGGWNCGQVLGCASQQNQGPHHMMPILRRPGPVVGQGQRVVASPAPAAGGWGANRASPGWERPEPGGADGRAGARSGWDQSAQRGEQPAQAPAHVTVVHAPRAPVGDGGEAAPQRERAEPVPVRAEPVSERAPVEREAAPQPQRVVEPAPVRESAAPREPAPAPERAAPSSSRDQTGNAPNWPGR